MSLNASAKHTRIHEIKHDGYRMIVRKEGGNVRLYSRKAIDWSRRLPAIARGAALLKAKSFTIDGEAVVVGPDGLTDFEALRRRVERAYPVSAVTPKADMKLILSGGSGPS